MFRTGLSCRERALHAFAIVWLLVAATTIAAPNAARADGDEDGDGLGDAAREARSSGRKKRVLIAKPREGEAHQADECAWFLQDDEGDDPDGRILERLLEGWHAGLIANGGIGGQDLAPAGDVGVRVGRRLAPGLQADLDLLAGPRAFTPATPARGAFDRPSELALETSLRWFPVRDERPAALGVLIGARGARLAWRYHRAVLADDGTGIASVADDALFSWAPYAGLALTLHESRKVHLGAALKLGATWYDGHSAAGFRNDLFRATGFARVEFEARIPSRP